MNKEIAVALMRLVAVAAGVSATPYLERLAVARLGNLNRGEGVRALHCRINDRAEAVAAAECAEDPSDGSQWEAAYEQLDEEQEAADLGFSSVEEMLVARRTPHLGYDSVDEYSLLDEDQEVEQRAFVALKAIWNQ